MRSDAEAYGHARQEIRRETLARADKLRQQRRRVLLDRTGLCLRVTLKEAPQERAFCKQITRAGRHNGRPARPDLFKVGGQAKEQSVPTRLVEIQHSSADALLIMPALAGLGLCGLYQLQDVRNLSKPAGTPRFAELMCSILRTRRTL